MKKTIPWFSLLLVLPMLLFGGDGKKAPNFSLQTAEGKRIELAKLKGKVVVVNFWATWCGPCKAEIPSFVKIYQKYRRKGVEIVGISLDEKGWAVVKPFIEKYRITYPVVLDDGSVADAYGGIRAIPTTFIIDRKGNIVDTHVGYLSEEAFESKIRARL
ncbi:MAG: TlpA disulfide reductase family protein [Bacteroidota bacterium]|nr:TlpA disulfide reductase family protein [Bacteroidota bacterium]